MSAVWIPLNPGVYVPRCSKCGRFKDQKKLYTHWFFTGVNCVSCVQDRLYNNARTIKKISK